MTDDDRSEVPPPGPVPGSRSDSGPEPTRQFPQSDGNSTAYSQWEATAPAPGLQGQMHPQAGQQQYAEAAAAMATNTMRRVRSMPWQERVMRLTGTMAVFAGALTLLSCLFSWWAMFDRSMGTMVEYTVAPFRGVSASGGSRWGEMAAMNSLSSSDLSAVRSLSITVGVVLVVAALCLVAGGLLIAFDRAQLLGASLMLAGSVFLGYARVPSESLGNIGALASDANSALSDPSGIFSELFASIIPEARFGLGLSTFALTIITLALLIYLGMIIYRETIRIRRWMA